MMVLLKNECSFCVWDNHRWWGKSNPSSCLKNFKFMHSQVVRMQTLILANLGASASTLYEPPSETFTDVEICWSLHSKSNSSFQDFFHSAMFQKDLHFCFPIFVEFSLVSTYLRFLNASLKKNNLKTQNGKYRWSMWSWIIVNLFTTAVSRKFQYCSLAGFCKWPFNQTCNSHFSKLNLINTVQGSLSRGLCLGVPVHGVSV